MEKKPRQTGAFLSFFITRDKPRVFLFFSDNWDKPFIDID